MGWLRKNDYQPAGKHCYITGGSSGLGKALAESLVRQGAHVSIVGRDVAKAEKVVEELKSFAPHSQQIIQSISADLVSPTASEKAIHNACAAHGGRAPDYVFLCAGFSRPGLFVEMDKEQLRNCHDGVYWVSAYTAHEATRMMAQQRREGKVVFVGSFLSFTTFAGYASYSPGKYALRGLADALRSEMLLHNISIHLFTPCGILGPGFDAENKTKPTITKRIEEGDIPIPPEKCAAALEAGLRKGYYQITDSWKTEPIRLRSNGGVPSNNVFMDTLYWAISSVAVPIWRMTADHTVKKSRKEVEKDLTSRGFYE
ncbi:3-ketodihydrosphingosine reductase TSC10 [Cryptococcus depauperatus]|nr:3-ketodihydrosphingosine reductase TSC10 [Cryptococcus depauperatus CBS 7855]